LNIKLGCFILEAAKLLVYLAQTWVVPQNILNRATWSWLNPVISLKRFWKTPWLPKKLPCLKQLLISTNRISFTVVTSSVGNKRCYFFSNYKKGCLRLEGGHTCDTCDFDSFGIE